MANRSSLKALGKAVQAVLDRYVPNPQPPLWHSDPFTLLVAVLLSAQCTDERVNKVTPKLFARAPTPHAMAHLPLETIRAIIAPCGLSNRKAFAIQSLSKALIEHFHGRVPQSIQDLESLPGVGHKTASVVLVQAFHQPAFPVDRHILRSAHRWHLSDKKTVEGVEEDLKRIFPKKSWGTIHLQIVLFARTFCPAKSHTVQKCPMCQMTTQFWEKRNLPAILTSS